MINSVQYENIKLGNYSSLSDVINENFIIKCDNIIINDKNKGNALNDGTFFGILVMPKFNQNLVNSIYNCNYVKDANSDLDIVVKSFDLEIDSRTFELLNYKEFYLYLKYEIEKYQNIENILKEYYDFITVYCAHHSITINRTGKTEVQLLYYMMARDYILNTISIPRMEDLFALDELNIVDKTEMNKVIEIGRKILMTTGYITKYSTNNKFLTAYLLITLNAIDSMKRDAIKYITILKNENPSKLYSKVYDVIIDCLEKITNNNINVVTEAFSIRNTRLYLDFKNSGGRRLEDKIYETSIQAKSIRDKDDAMICLREINSSIKILDALITTPGIDDFTKKRYEDLRIRYLDLREEVLSNRNINRDANVITLSELLRGNYSI